MYNLYLFDIIYSSIKNFQKLSSSNNIGELGAEYISIMFSQLIKLTILSIDLRYINV